MEAPPVSGRYHSDPCLGLGRAVHQGQRRQGGWIASRLGGSGFLLLLALLFTPARWESMGCYRSVKGAFCTRRLVLLAGEEPVLT